LEAAIKNDASGIDAFDKFKVFSQRKTLFTCFMPLACNSISAPGLTFLMTEPAS
jgi:hypothetical protein